MSNFTHKAGNGAIFKNENKKTETHPDYNGTATLENGEIVDLALWVKTAKTGKKFFSLTIKAVKADPAEPTTAAAAATGDDDLPF